MAVLLVGCRTTTSDKEASSKAPFSANTMGEILKLVQANGDFDKNLRSNAFFHQHLYYKLICSKII